MWPVQIYIYIRIKGIVSGPTIVVSNLAANKSPNATMRQTVMLDMYTGVAYSHKGFSEIIKELPITPFFQSFSMHGAYCYPELTADEITRQRCEEINGAKQWPHTAEQAEQLPMDYFNKAMTGLGNKNHHTSDSRLKYRSRAKIVFDISVALHHSILYSHLKGSCFSR